MKTSGRILFSLAAGALFGWIISLRLPAAASILSAALAAGFIYASFIYRDRTPKAQGGHEV